MDLGFIVLLFVILIILALTLPVLLPLEREERFNLTALLLGVGSFALGGVYLYLSSTSREGFIPWTNSTVLPDGTENIDTDDLSLSRSGNISVSGDLDSLQQRTIELDFPSGEGFPDNSDVVEEVLSRGNTIFQPSRGYGTSSLTSAEMGAFQLASPSGLPYLDDTTSYDIPLTNTTDLDEKLAIGQQHRAGINKRAIDGHVRSTKNLYQKYFTNELRENEQNDWWSAEAEDAETDFWTST